MVCNYQESISVRFSTTGLGIVSCLHICYFYAQDELQKYMVGSDTVDPIITEIVTTVSAKIMTMCYIPYIIRVTPIRKHSWEESKKADWK